jgi:hypothetical protein
MCRLAGCQHLLLAFVLGAAATGCGKFREVSACRSIAREVNTAMDEIEPLSKQRPMDEARIAKRYAALARALQPRTLGQSSLASAVREYVAILQATDVALRNHDQALKIQYGKLNDPRRELERLVKREHAAATRIEVECEH